MATAATIVSGEFIFSLSAVAFSVQVVLKLDLLTPDKNQTVSTLTLKSLLGPTKNCMRFLNDRRYPEFLTNLRCPTSLPMQWIV